MMESREHQTRTTLNRLLKIYTVTSSALEESVALLQAELASLESSPGLGETKRVSGDPQQVPVIDRRSMSVVYRDRHCFLGDTLMLGLIERLTQRVNEYVAYEELLSKVWHGRREASTVRSVVKEVKKRLAEAKMTDLANAIDGRVSHHYGLILTRNG